MMWFYATKTGSASRLVDAVRRDTDKKTLASVFNNHRFHRGVNDYPSRLFAEVRNLT